MLLSGDGDGYVQYLVLGGIHEYIFEHPVVSIFHTYFRLSWIVLQSFKRTWCMRKKNSTRRSWRQENNANPFFIGIVSLLLCRTQFVRVKIFAILTDKKVFKYEVK